MYSKFKIVNNIRMRKEKEFTFLKSSDERETFKKEFIKKELKNENE